MFSYIADNSIEKLLQSICKRRNILILNGKDSEYDIKQYIKETKINFNLIKYLFIDIRLLKNTDEEIIENIYNFSNLYNKMRIIIFAPNYEEQNIILTTLYNRGFYNIINESSNEEIEKKLNTILDVGLNQNDSKKFKKKEEIVNKENKLNSVFDRINNKSKIKKKNFSKYDDIPINRVYLFSLLLEAVTRLIKFICYILIFILTSIGLTILLNSELRVVVFQIFGLK